MNKDKIEQMCRKAGLIPARRETIKGHDVCVADGFSTEPHVTFARMGVAKGEFPNGCYVTMWWAAQGEERMQMAEPLFCNPDHDPEYDLATRKRARINAAIKRAHEVLTQREGGHG